MNYLFLKKIIGIIFVGFIIFHPQNLFASEISFKIIPNNITGDKATIVEAYINPESKNINAVEGTINFSGVASDNLSINIETGGSLLTLWPIEPKYVSAEKSIYFVGGAPKGFSKTGLLFRMRISSALDGEVTISSLNQKAYLNDGKGTEDKVFTTPLTINLERPNTDDIKSLSLDNTPPRFQKTEIGKDPSLYDGEYFMTLHATDDITGVDRYEIREGEFIINSTDGIYVLHDQGRKTPLYVKVYDKAGNSKSVKISPRFHPSNNVILIVVSFLIVLYVYKKFIKK